VFVCPLVLVGITYYSSGSQDALALRAQVANPTHTAYVLDAVDLRIDRDDRTGAVINQGVFEEYALDQSLRLRSGALVDVPIKGPWSTDTSQNIGDARLSCHADAVSS
jgi:hypothetical protein